MTTTTMQNLKLLRNEIAAYWVVIVLLHLIVVSTAKTTFYIYEGKARGELVGNLNTSILHVNPQPTKFDFDAQTGVIKSNATLDREVKSIYRFNVVTQTLSNIQVDIIVRDINDEFPIFSTVNKTVYISEAYDVGHIYNLDLKVTDKDVGANSIGNDSVRIISGNVDSVFKINLKQHHSFYAVSLEIAKKLNWTAKHKYSLNLSASDSGTPRKTSYITLTVNVVDYNNCPPQFSRQSYAADVSESVTQGTIVLNITTSDCDGGKNAEVTYKMKYDSYYDKDRHFRIQQENRIGYIVTNLPLDFEKTKVYKLRVIATDKGISPKQSVVDVTVFVRDENDNSPEIGRFFFYPINEDAKVDSCVARIKISDKDSGENGKLNVSLDPMNVFSISKISQDIYHVFLKSTLDHENTKTYHIIVTATDNGKPPRTSKDSGTLSIGDVNDNPPRFDQDIYTGDILESELPGTSVLTVNATDKDDSLNITYHILSTNTSWFGINSTSGVIYVASFIDREQSDNVFLVIQAFDGKFTANCTVVLRIIDSNDNAPQFSNPHYIMTVLENSLPGMFVGKVVASDVDLTSKGHISFALGYPNNTAFTINKMTGNITTIKELDREDIDTYNFTILAQDEGGLKSTAMITVLVDDVNDNRPFFKNDFYNYTVYENISAGADLIKIEAKDYDIGWNAQISYEIISGNDDGTFHLDKSNGQISLHKELDREKVDKYVLKIRAVDNGGLTSHKLATVQILVKDVNDDPPVFQKDKYNFYVKENGSMSVFVGTMQANSYDQGSGGIISYSIKTLDSQQHFSINDSGAIFTKARLDHEIQSKYEFLVEARDHGTPSLFGYVNATVTVIDINDNFPVWKDYDHCIELHENHPVGDEIHVFKAFDKDSGLNGKVTYSIVSGPDSMFNLNSETGYLSLNMPVDYEQVQLYHLTVNASDSGKPVLWSLLNVNICVIDVNDNVPVLHNSSVNVKEDLPIHALIYTFHAVDEDSGKNGRVWYNFIDNTPNHFELDRDGNLTLKSPLDRETQDKYEVFVIAGDQGVPIKTSTPAKLTIYVQDVNDERPVFTNKLSFLTTENKKTDTLIGKVKAKDRDLGKNAEIEYSLINSTDNFKIDSGTGELRNIVVLDREKFPIYRVLVQASDKGNPPKSSRVTVNVHVQDVNDNPPVFTKSLYHASVAENAEKGARVTQVKAVDRDEGQNGLVNYYHNTGNTQGGVEMFQINETTGLIYIVASLDREIKDLFVLSVIAKDNGSPLKESVCQVLITILDVNDHKPEFRVKNDTIYISEKTSVGSVVYWANATDQDKDENGNIIYSIVKESGEHVFTINAKTGAVSLNKALDYEHTKQYSLRIKASDKAKDNPKKSILRLYINILDSNDNGPIFDENPIEANVNEGVPRGTSFHNPILARDKDSGINSRIVYSIESQSPKPAFKIDPFKAQLSTDVEIDREDVSEYKLVVKAVDQAGEVSEQKSNTVTVIVRILDINDCYPVFTSQNKSFIMEDEPVNFTVFYFTAEDKDQGQAGNVTFSLEKENNGIFYLDPYWGSLILMKPLDREKVHTYPLKIKASDQGSPPLSSTITFTLSVEDVNDNLPRFLSYIYQVNVSENVDVAHVLKVKATDLDSGQLKYSLPPGFANDLFIINESTGQILTNSGLDREKQQMYELTVYVQDHGYPLYTDSATVKINVTDKNDNVPIVLQNVYEVKVLENSPAGYVCSIIGQDFDIAINARLTYSIEAEEGNNAAYFEIDKNTGTLSTVSPLDREISPVHNLIVKVEDQGRPSLSTSVKVSVIVLDVNDNNPKFGSSEINLNLTGSSQPGTEVVTLRATDDDDDSNTAITYSFCSEQQIPFALDSTTGLIYTVNYLNASEIDMYSFCVNASDGSESRVRFGSIKVNVFVGRMTGTPLRFTKVLYEVDFKTQIKAGIEILQLQFKNKHLKPGDVEYIREGGQKVLAVGLTRGNVSFTEDPMPGAYLLSVRATLIHDRSMTAVCFVLVTVKHTIQRPSFSHSYYSATLNENDPPGTRILTVKPNGSGNVSYQIVNGNEFDAFKIDSNGEVTVKKDNALDYERSRSFELDIKGDWGNTITNIAFTKLYLTLRNLNDKAPAFRQKVFVSNIPESSATSDNRFVTKLYAFNFGNTQMSFTIVSGNKESVFALDLVTGELSLRKAVDREKKSFYNLTVSVSTGQLSSKCTVLVFITDINDNLPQLPRRINLTIFENSLLGSHVGQVNATDEDEYSVLTYSFSGNMQRNGPFVIDLDTGILRLVDVIDFETRPNLYSMDVVVSDQVHKASTKVFVTVLDENDHRPLFEKSSYSVKRKEPISANTYLARINATDEDQGSNKRITYNITLNDEIGIDSNTGIVFTKKQIIYSKDFIDLIITATDHGSPKLSSQVPFRLQILHVNNKPPDLGNTTYEVTISENIEVGTEVVRIKPLNFESLAGKKRISFQILNGDELKMFRIEERTGIIRVRRQLDRENTDLYNLEVIAKDGSQSGSSDRLTVRIIIDDVNDNTPVFQRNRYYVNDSMYEESIAEDVKPPRLVLSVLAKDKDSGRNKEIKYSISSGNNDGWFSMRENELWLVSPLDRDVIPIHRLSVRATDQGK